MNSFSPVKPAIPPEAVTALTNGNKIEAIKIIREKTGLGLKESKELAEEYVESNPALKAAMDSAQAVSLQGLKWVAVIIALTGACIYFFASQ